jgi:short-subunit dehydrogenase
MKILVTGASSGVGKGLVSLLGTTNNVIGLTRQDLDLSKLDQVLKFDMTNVDMLINCAGSDKGGKIEFVQHDPSEVVDIININLIAPVLLSQKALKLNTNCKVVNITSTNNIRYYPNNLTYSLTKKALESFTNMLRIEYPLANILEIRLGLTRTNFNYNRYTNHQDRFIDIYANNPHLTVDNVVAKINNILFNNTVTFIEISP